MRLPLLLGCLALASVLPGTAADAQRDEDTRSRIDTTIAFGARGIVDLALVSGEIKVTRGASDDVTIHATSERGILRLDASPSRIGLNVRSDRGHMGDTRYDVQVPSGTRVVLRSVSGNLSITGVHGEVDAHSVSGDVVIGDAADHVTFEAVSGDVRIDGVAGDVRGTTVSGDLTAQHVTGEVEVESVSGELELHDITSKYVRTKTVSGETTFEGSIDPSGRYEFNAHSGDVRLRINDDASAAVSVDTYSGDVDSDFKMLLQPGERRRGHMEFTIGGGAAHLRISTFSGDVTLQRAGGRR